MILLLEFVLPISATTGDIKQSYNGKNRSMWLYLQSTEWCWQEHVRRVARPKTGKPDTPREFSQRILEKNLFLLLARGGEKESFWDGWQRHSVLRKVCSLNQPFNWSITELGEGMNQPFNWSLTELGEGKQPTPAHSGHCFTKGDLKKPEKPVWSSQSRGTGSIKTLQLISHLTVTH